jgi:hypothetical protein
MTDNKPILDVEAVLAIGSLALFAAALASVIFHTLPTENEKYAMLMLGALIGVVKDTFGRYFQATKGNQDLRKDFTDLAQAAVSTTAAPGTVTVSPPSTVTVEAP